MEKPDSQVVKCRAFLCKRQDLMAVTRYLFRTALERAADPSDWKQPCEILSTEIESLAGNWKIQPQWYLLLISPRFSQQWSSLGCQLTRQRHFSAISEGSINTKASHSFFLGLGFIIPCGLELTYRYSPPHCSDSLQFFQILASSFAL